MREKLKEIEDVRATFTGTFERFGTKSGWRRMVRTILIREIKNTSGVSVTDHLWFNLTKGFELLHLREGDIVQFDARVKEYVKGYKGYRRDVYSPITSDFKLSHPTKLIKIGRVNQ